MNSNVIMIPAKKADVSEQKLRTAAYCRVSSDSTDQLNSYMAQVRYYEKFLSESDTAILVNVYADEGITGTRMDKRDEFLRMLRDCRKGKIDRIITKSVSRFARNTKECLSVIRELKSLGITIMFEKEGIDTANVSDEMMITIMGGLAQEESVSISNNLQWSIHNKMKQGTYITNTTPFGYKKVNKKMFVYHDEARLVCEIYNMYLSGKGFAEICKILNKRNQSESIRSCWTKGSIKYILSNEKYIGDSLWRKSYTTQTFPFKRSINKGDVEQYYVHYTHEGIISRKEFNIVQGLLDKRSNEYGNKEFGMYSFTKKIKCGICNKLYKRRPLRDTIYWTCSLHDMNKTKCQNKRIREQNIKESFVMLYNKLKLHYSSLFPPLLSQLQDLKNKKHTGNQQYMEIQKETAKLKEQLHVLARLKTKGFIDDEKYITQSTELCARIEKLNTELRKLSQADDEDEVIDQISELADIIKNDKDLMTEFDEVMFESIVEKIIVMNQNTLEFHLHGGLKFTEKI